MSMAEGSQPTGSYQPNSGHERKPEAEIMAGKLPARRLLSRVSAIPIRGRKQLSLKEETWQLKLQ
jgi:hypothetical protein